MTARSVIAAEHTTPRFGPLGNKLRSKTRLRRVLLGRWLGAWRLSCLKHTRRASARLHCRPGLQACCGWRFAPACCAAQSVGGCCRPRNTARFDQAVQAATLAFGSSASTSVEHYHAGLRRAQEFGRSSQAIQRSAVSSSAAVRPNKSFNRTRRGKAPWPGGEARPFSTTRPWRLASARRLTLR